MNDATPIYGTHMFPDKMIPDESQSSVCFCVGPQNGEPLCPCSMKNIIKRNGRWVRPEQDLGPAITSPPSK